MAFIGEVPQMLFVLVYIVMSAPASTVGQDALFKYASALPNIFETLDEYKESQGKHFSLRYSGTVWEVKTQLCICAYMYIAYKYDFYSAPSDV